MTLASGLSLVVIIAMSIFALRDGGVGLGAWVLPVGLLGLVAALLLLGALSALRRPTRRRRPELTQEEAAARLPETQIWAGTLGIISSVIQLALSFFRTDEPSVWWFLLNAAVLAASCGMVVIGRRQRERLQSYDVAGPSGP